MEVNNQFHTSLLYSRRKENRCRLNSRLVASWSWSESVGRKTVTGFCLASNLNGPYRTSVTVASEVLQLRYCCSISDVLHKVSSYIARSCLTVKIRNHSSYHGSFVSDVSYGYQELPEEYLVITIIIIIIIIIIILITIIIIIGLVIIGRNVLLRYRF